MSKLTRRQLASLCCAASSAAALTAGCRGQAGHPAGAELTGRAPPSSGLGERWVPTVCGECPLGCCLRLRIVAGQAVWLEGGGSPWNGSGTCPAAQAAIESVYHPERLSGPLRRIGRRGAGQFERIGWAEAIRLLAEKLFELRGGGRPQALLLLDGSGRTSTAQLWSRFMQAFGSPNYIRLRPAAELTMLAAVASVMGQERLPAVDWPRVRTVLAFGRLPLHGNAAFAHQLFSGEQPAGRKIVLASPHCIGADTKADWWLAIKPGSYPALAYGLAHVLIRDGLIDLAFVAERATGFDDADRGGGERAGSVPGLARTVLAN